MVEFTHAWGLARPCERSVGGVMALNIERVAAKSVLLVKLRLAAVIVVATASLAVGGSATLAETALSSTSLDSNGDSVVFNTGSATVGPTGTAIGDNSTATGNNSTAVGANSTASGDSSSAFGANSTASGRNSVAVGMGASAFGANSTAIGTNAFVAASGFNSVALGQGSIATRPNTVSVGAPGQERQITNVAAGVAPTDAANVGQLNALQSQVTGNLTEARRGIAAASALAYVPTPSGPGRTTFALNGSYFQREGGVGVAVAHRFASEIPLYFSAAYGNGGGTQHVGRVGMAVEW
jgi:autotransporter adhesin